MNIGNLDKVMPPENVKNGEGGLTEGCPPDWGKPDIGERVDNNSERSILEETPIPDWKPENLDPYEDELPEGIDIPILYDNTADTESESLENDYDRAFREAQIEKQEQEIAKVESGEKKLETDAEKGNYGEMKMDQHMRQLGYERISKDMVTDIDEKGHQGIDGVYYKEDGHPQYVIGEAKYDQSKLGETEDGKQMSENWIDKRLDDAVGKEKADEIRMEMLTNPDNVCTCLCKIYSDYSIRMDMLDTDANVTEKDVEFNE